MDSIKQQLKAAWYATRELDRLYDEYCKLKARAERMTPTYSLAPGGGGSQDQMANKATMLADMERDYQSSFQALRDTIKDVQIIISSLDDFQMRLIMEDRYLALKKWEEIAVDRHYSYRYVIMLHGEALKILSDRVKDSGQKC